MVIIQMIYTESFDLTYKCFIFFLSLSLVKWFMICMFSVKFDIHDDARHRGEKNDLQWPITCTVYYRYGVIEWKRSFCVKEFERKTN